MKEVPAGKIRWLKVTATLAGLMILAISSPAAGSGLPLSLDEALKRATASSPLVRRAQAELAAVASRRVGAGIVLPSNPVVGVNVGAFVLDDVSLGGQSLAGGTGVEWGIHLQQAIEIAGQRGKRLAEVDQALATAKIREHFALVEARASTRIAYLSGLLANEQLDAERLRESLAAKLLDSVNLQFKTGAGSEVEVTLAQADWGQITAARLQAESQREKQLAQLRTLIGMKQTEEVLLNTTLSPPNGEIPPLQSLITAAMEQRADLAALRSQAREIDATLLRLRRERVPSPSLAFDLTSQPEVAGQAAQMVITGGLSFELPVARRQQGEIASAQAERSRLATEEMLSEQAIAEEVTIARADLMKRRAEVKLFENVILPAVTRQSTLVTAGWKAGKFDFFRVITAARDEAMARRDRLTALGALWQAAITLERATGAL